MDLKTFVIENVKPDDYYKWRFPKWDARSRPNVSCPWHDDETPSMAVGLTGGGARCHSPSCGKRLGNIIHFESQRANLPETDVAKILYSKFIGPIFPQKKLYEYQRALIRTVESWLAKDTSLNKVSVQNFKLGWDSSSKRITVPIFSTFGFATNIRYYQLPRHRTHKTIAKIYNADGYGKLDLFPRQCFRSLDPSRPLFWMKAEKDTMLAIQMGLQAFCITNGESTWMDEILTLFNDFDIIICGDNDPAGITAAKKRFALLQEQGKKVYGIAKIPFTRVSSKLKDFADWVLFDRGSKQALLALYREIKKPKLSSPPPSGTNGTLRLPERYSEDYQELISIGRQPSMLNRIIRVRAIVAAKSDRTFTLPIKLLISTPGSPKREFSIPIGRELLRMVRCSDEQAEHFIKANILGNPKCKYEATEYITVTEVELIPVISPDRDSPYVTQRAFYFGHEIHANIPYELEVIPTSEIRTQETVGIVVSAVPISRPITSFDLSKQEFKTLEVFKSEGDVMASLYNIANDFANQFSGIYYREDWHVAAFLSFYCPLHFNFPNEGTQRGWFNTLVVGDTQTGKSEVVKALREITNAGTFVNSENCTLVGLVGGCIKGAGGQFMLRWGKLPINDRQLVVLEEFSGLSIEEIANLSEVRSSGKARLDKGGLSSETSSRTRLICLSNVRGKNRSLAGYISGVRAIQDLIGHAEDISRFDLIVTLTDREVSAEIINQPRFFHRTNFLDANAFKLLIKFVWSLGPDQIEITTKAYQACLSGAIQLSKMYHPSIPLFKAGSGRMKLARIAVAIACFQFNWNGRLIKVEDKHVQAAIALLQKFFDKPSCGYKEYSEQMMHREKIYEEDYLNSIWMECLRKPNQSKTLAQYMLHTARFTVDELSQVSGTGIGGAEKIIGAMVRSNVLNKGEANVWMISPVGKGWLERVLKGEVIQPMNPVKLNGNSKPISTNKFARAFKR